MAGIKQGSLSEEKIAQIAYNTAIEAAIAATDVIAPFWPNHQNVRFNRKLALEVIEKEGTGNYATIADFQSEKKIIEIIQSKPLLRNHSILSEESEEIKADEEWRWIIDPIDGTPNFRNGNPDFGICIALFNGQKPVVGLIAMPGLRQLAVAGYGEDAKLLTYDGKEIANLRDLAQKYSDPIAKALVGYDLGYKNRAGQMKDIAEKLITKVGYAFMSCFIFYREFQVITRDDGYLFRHESDDYGCGTCCSSYSSRWWCGD
jgi:fructose-1,6-bisphosphatase/inositol monophosphatase family enzyme